MAQTIVELFEDQVHQSSVRPALRRHRDGVWEEFTWKEWWDASERVAAGLIEAGLNEGEKVCVVVSTRMEWAIIDMGLAMAGAVGVPLHVATPAQELTRVLFDNEIRIVIAEDPVQLGKVLEAQREVSCVEYVIYLDDDVLVSTGRSRRSGDFMRVESLALPSTLRVDELDDVMGRGRSVLAEEPRFVARRRRAIDADTVASVLYTSGVSDRPRGVVLTHGNLAAQVDALSGLHLFSSDDVQLLCLPLAHIFARVLYLVGVGYGLTTVFARGPQRLSDDLAEVEPTLMASVPRVYRRLQRDIVKRLQRRKIRSRLLPVALEVGRAVSQRSQQGERVGPVLRWEHKLFSSLLLEEVYEHLGGQMSFLISAGSPLADETAEFFISAGIVVLEGYGLTETSGAVSFNMPDDYRIGSVGKPLPGVDVTIAEDGEIFVRGETIMKCYVDGANEPARGVDDEGWLHTGDLGRFDGDGFLFLTGRKRELIVTSTGKHVVPEGIEQDLCEHPLVAHSVLAGEGRPWLAALLALDPDGVLDFVDRHDIDGDRPVRELTGHRRLRQELQAHLDEVNRRRSSYDRVRTFAVLPEFLSVRNQTLSASGELRRMEVLRRFEEEVEALFQEEGENF